MQQLRIGNKTISTPLLTIIKDIRNQLTNGKLRSIIPRGDNIRITCPTHKMGRESTPASDVYVGEDSSTPYGWFRCFVCEEQGPFYHFVAECFDKTDDWAKEWLIDNYCDGIIEKAVELPELVLKSSKKQYLDDKILNTFENYHPYLAQRKIPENIARTFEVKYDPKSNCIVFPVRDETGKLVMLTRRSVETKKFIIDKGVEKPVYLLYYLKQHNIEEAYVVESQINALTVMSHGLPAIGLIGTGSSNQYEVLNKSGIRIYNLLFDGDDAGDKGVRNFIANIRKDVIVNVIPMYRGKDVNDLSYDELEHLIQKYR